MGFRPIRWSDDDLEEFNDATASAAAQGNDASLDASALNALICEVQAWRRANPHTVFVPGPNDLIPSDWTEKIAAMERFMVSVSDT